MKYRSRVWVTVVKDINKRPGELGGLLEEQIGDALNYETMGRFFKESGDKIQVTCCLDLEVTPEVALLTLQGAGFTVNDDPSMREGLTYCR
jgi:hypothetical protein